MYERKKIDKYICQQDQRKKVQITDKGGIQISRY